MKTIKSAAIAAAFIVFTTACLLAASPPKGLLIYSEPPSTYAESCEFTTITSGPAYIIVVRPDGQKFQMNSNAVMNAVEYPPLNPQTDTQEKASLNLDKIHSLERRYPQFLQRLQAAEAKWTNALAFAKQMAASTPAKVNTPAKEESPSAGFSLTVNGVKYTDVQLTSVDDDSAGISHSDGVAKLPLEVLTNEQIAALNGTSSTAHIDPNWAVNKLKKLAEEKQKAEAEKQRLSAAAENTQAQPMQAGTSSDPTIAAVKDGVLYTIDRSTTLGKAFDGYRYFTSKAWKIIPSESGRKVVQVTGTIDFANFKAKDFDTAIARLNGVPVEAVSGDSQSSEDAISKAKRNFKAIQLIFEFTLNLDDSVELSSAKSKIVFADNRVMPTEMKEEEMQRAIKDIYDGQIPILVIGALMSGAASQ
jgi:hypothetical protein